MLLFATFSLVGELVQVVNNAARHQLDTSCDEMTHGTYVTTTDPQIATPTLLFILHPAISIAPR